VEKRGFRNKPGEGPSTGAGNDYQPIPLLRADAEREWTRKGEVLIKAGGGNSSGLREGVEGVFSAPASVHNIGEEKRDEEGFG